MKNRVLIVLAPILLAALAPAQTTSAPTVPTTVAPSAPCDADSLTFEQVQAIRKRLKSIGDYKIETTKVTKKGRLRREITTYHVVANGQRRIRIEAITEDPHCNVSSLMIFDGAAFWFVFTDLALKMPGVPELDRLVAEFRPKKSDAAGSPIEAVRPAQYSARRELHEGHPVIHIRETWTEQERELVVQRSKSLVKQIAGVDFDTLTAAKQRKMIATLQQSLPASNEELIDEKTGFVLVEKTFDRDGKPLRHDEQRLLESHQSYDESLFTVPADVKTLAPTDAEEFVKLLQEHTKKALRKAIKKRQTK